MKHIRYNKNMAKDNTIFSSSTILECQFNLTQYIKIRQYLFMFHGILEQDSCSGTQFSVPFHDWNSGKGSLDLTPTEVSVVFVSASSCSKNKSVVNKDRSEQPSQHNMYVDDDMVADIKHRLIQALVVAIEAIFVIMAFPNLSLSPCAVAMDKWLKLNVKYC